MAKKRKNKQIEKQVTVNDAKDSKSIISDSMYNVISGLGIKGQARTASTKPKEPQVLSHREWELFYSGNGVVSKIINTYAEAMTQDWFSIGGDSEDGELEAYIHRLRTQDNFTDLVRWAYLMGGAIIIMLIDDGREINEPVDENNIKTIESLRVVDLSQIKIFPENYYNDPLKSRYGEPEIYTITPIAFGTVSTTLTYDVHESRILRLDGTPVTDYLRSLNNQWMAPVMQAYYWDIINLEQAYTWASEYLHDLVVSVYGVKDLSQKLATSDGETAVTTRLSLINYAKSALNAVILDSDCESYERISSAVSQIDDLLEKFERKLCAMSGIPYSILFGDQRSGLSQGDNIDLGTWNSQIHSAQELKLKPLIMKLVKYITLASDSDFKGKFDDIEIDFDPIVRYSQKELIDMRKVVADMDVEYIDRGVLTAEEVRKRFENDTFDLNLQIVEPLDDESFSSINKQAEDVMQQHVQEHHTINQNMNMQEPQSAQIEEAKE